MKREFLFILVSLFLSGPVLAQTQSSTEFEIPSRAKRIAAFERAGILKDVQELDELDQDLLFMRAQQKSWTDLQKLYPKTNPQKLRALQGELRRKR